MSVLKHNASAAPLSWWRYDDGTVRVVCSKGHRSTVQHIIQPDGRLVPPHGKDASMHCGHKECNEEMPLQLEGWLP